jgi:hypothetical protein
VLKDSSIACSPGRCLCAPGSDRRRGDAGAYCRNPTGGVFQKTVRNLLHGADAILGSGIIGMASLSWLRRAAPQVHGPLILRCNGTRPLSESTT